MKVSFYYWLFKKSARFVSEILINSQKPKLVKIGEILKEILDNMEAVTGKDMTVFAEKARARGVKLEV